jgi:hypothetical protein
MNVYIQARLPKHDKRALRLAHPKLMFWGALVSSERVYLCKSALVERMRGLMV